MKHRLWLLKERIQDFLFPSDIATKQQSLTGHIETHHNRLTMIAVMLMFGFIIIVITLLRLSLTTPHSIHTTTTKGVPRADILDRNGVVLATTLQTVSLAVNPKKIINPIQTAQNLIKIFPSLSLDDIKDDLTKHTSFVWIKRDLTPEQQEKTILLGNPAFSFIKAYPRVYPQGNLFSHILGFTNIDGRGIAGLEKQYDKQLRTQKNPLKLTVDSRIQFIIRHLLKKSVDRFKAQGGVAILMDVKNGDIISLVSLPDFDPNHPDLSPAQNLFNQATLGVYELGSIFKIFTISTGLDHQDITLKDKFDVSKPLHIGRFVIHDDIPQKGSISVADIFSYSSNIGASQIALKYGAEVQKDYFKRMGFFDPSPLNIPEIGTPLVPHRWSTARTVTASYGYGLAVSPLQVVTAVAGIVSDGMLPVPNLVMGQEHHKETPILHHTSVVQKIRQLMYLNVLHGTAKSSNVPAYRVGGKTGTAEKASHQEKGYHVHRLISSFASAFPIDHPRYALYVLLQGPQKTKYNPYSATAAATAVPLTKKIVTQIAPLLHIMPQSPNDPSFLKYIRIPLYPKKLYIDSKR